MLAWWVTDLWNNPNFNGKVVVISQVYWVIFAIVLHELSHGWAAIWCGDRTPIETGHMTWNPLVHMGPISLLMFAVAGIAWGLMPVNPNNFRRPWHDALVAFAGPAMNLLLAGLAIFGYALWIAFAHGSVNDTLFKNTVVFLRFGILLNFALFILNMLPVPPLDGSRIAAFVFPSYRRVLESEQAQSFTLVAFLVIFLFGGSYIFGAAMDATLAITDAIDRIL